MEKITLEQAEQAMKSYLLARDSILAPKNVVYYEVKRDYRKAHLAYIEARDKYFALKWVEESKRDAKNDEF